MTAACYCRVNGTIVDPLSGKCQRTPCSSDDGKVVSCCGSSALCGANGFCFYYGPSGSVNTTGYYLGGCTDPKFASDACPSSCSDYGSPDVMWLPDKRKWRCCGAKGTKSSDCFAHKDSQTFEGRAPAGMTFTKAAAAAAATAAATGTSTVAAPTLAPETVTTTPTIPISTIVLAIVLPIFVVIAVVFGVLYWRRRRSTQHNETPAYPLGEGMRSGSEATLKPIYPVDNWTERSELGRSKAGPPELDPNVTRSELDYPSMKRSELDGGIISYARDGPNYF